MNTCTSPEPIYHSLDENNLCPMEKKGFLFKKERANTKAIVALSAALKHSSLTFLRFADCPVTSCVCAFLFNAR